MVTASLLDRNILHVTRPNECNRQLNRNPKLDLGMGHPTRTTQPNLPEKNPTRPDPSYVAGGRGPYFLTRNNQRAGHGP